MAGVEKIKERILIEAQEKVKEIFDSADSQVEVIKKESNDLANRKVKDIAQKAIHDASERKRIINSMVELELRKNILSAKQEVIEEVFQTALNKLNEMDSLKYEEIISDMILNTVSTGEEELMISEGSINKLSQNFLKKLNEKLNEKGYKGDIKLSTVKDSKFGGFIIKSTGIEINNSFESILRMSRDDLEPKVADLLF